MIIKRKKLAQSIIALIFILAAVLGYQILVNRKPVMEKTKRIVSLPIARVVSINKKDHQVIITAHGTVKTANEIYLVPQVKGKIIYVSPFLVNGGAFDKNDLLLKIDPADYQIALTMAKAKINDTESKYLIAQEESKAAICEWADFNKDTNPPDLVAKKPQLSAACAAYKASQANFEKAKLDLQRTMIRAPFKGIVSDKNVDIGQFVTSGQKLATLFSTNFVEIVVPLENKDLFWFNVPGFTSANGSKSEVDITVNVAGKQCLWHGRVVRAYGKIDEHTRMVHVVIKVQKPYSIKPPLAVGLFTEVKIKGITIHNAAVIPRSAIHTNNIVWVVDKKNKLEFRKVNIARFSEKGVIIRSGLAKGEKIVISPIKDVCNGMKIKSVLASRENM